MKSINIILSIALHFAIFYALYFFAKKTDIVLSLQQASPPAMQATTITETRLAELLKKTKPETKSYSKTSKKLVTIYILKQPKVVPEKPEIEQPKTEDKDEKVEVKDVSQAEPKTEEELKKDKENDARQQQLISKYHSKMQRSLITNWTRPSHIKLKQKLSVEVKLHLDKDGTIMDVSVHTSSGDDLFDRSAVASIKKNKKFIIPDDEELYKKYFNNIIIGFSNPD